MRAVVIAGVMVAAGAAWGQEKTITLADLEGARPALAGDRVQIVEATVFAFTENGGGMVRDRSGGSAKLDVAGMSPRTIYHLERYCSHLSTNPPRPECQGTLRFKVTLREEFPGCLTIRAADFSPHQE